MIMQRKQQILFHAPSPSLVLQSATCATATRDGVGETPLHQLSNTLLPFPSSLNACVQYLSSPPPSLISSPYNPAPSPFPLFCLLLFFHGGWFFRSPPFPYSASLQTTSPPNPQTIPSFLVYPPPKREKEGVELFHHVFPPLKRQDIDKQAKGIESNKIRLGLHDPFISFPFSLLFVIFEQ